MVVVMAHLLPAHLRRSFLTNLLVILRGILFHDTLEIELVRLPPRPVVQSQT